MKAAELKLSEEAIETLASWRKNNSRDLFNYLATFELVEELIFESDGFETEDITETVRLEMLRQLHDLRKDFTRLIQIDESAGIEEFGTVPSGININNSDLIE